MSEYKIIIESAGARVSVVSPSQELIRAVERSDFLKRYIPNCKILNDSMPTTGMVILKIGKPDFVIEYPKVEYTNTRYEDRDVVSLIEFLMEGIRQENNIYCLHSSSVVINGKGIIFWGGASEMGKTRLALALSERFGAEMYSDEKTLINLKENIIIGGIDSIYVSKPYLKNKFGKVEFYKFASHEQSFPVGFFIYPHINEDSNSIHVDRWDADKFNWHLYEEFSRKIRATSRRIFNNTLPVPSVDSALNAARRSAAVEAYVKSTPCYCMRGGEDLICEKILKLFN